MKSLSLFVFTLFFAALQLCAQSPAFTVIPLGVRGGSDESNLSSYMIATAGSDKFVCLDAGTVYSGIRKAIAEGLFNQSVHSVLRSNIHAYLISHAHLDHTAGMVLNSPDDSSKNIYALPSVIKNISDKYFTWESWANFADQGEMPALGKYHYVTLAAGMEKPIANTDMYVTAFSLSHVNPYESTAFLIRHQDSYFLYLGDTGADSLEKSGKLQVLWRHIAPLIQEKKLKGIFIEVSFPNEQPDNQLFGHLTPKWLMAEMKSLSVMTGREALDNFPIGIIHIKPIGNNKSRIRRQIFLSNELHLKIFYPEQGDLLYL